MKKGIYRIFLVAVACLGCVNWLEAQDAHYTQFYANQPLLNPAFTGAALGPRVSMNYRAQWVAIPGSFRQTVIGYDQPLYFGKSLQGIGGMISNDRAGEGNLTKLNAQMNYSFALQLGRYGHEQYVRFGLAGGIEQANIDFYKLRFSDQIDPRDGFIYATQEDPQKFLKSRYNPDVHAGIAYYNQYAWAGVTINHLTQPRQEFVGVSTSGIDSRLPMKYTVSAGLRLPAGQPNDPEKVVISPTVIFMKQRNFNQLNIGTYVTLDPIIFGVYWRTNYNNFRGDFIASDAVSGIIGFREGIFSIGYSYDYTISTLTNPISGGSHELALVMEFERDQPKSFKHRKLPCPRF